ncbi:TetR/AcrR family transcriptional regulator [Rhizobium sp. TRM95796]|uniref:TetR/AcrR family transcriptional regulator n=1 Tax=Rhizobium sp. TRM95796 TaxID=2979862 RepID=UPI0021E804DC|nr:TetR/AcrR family transcriptional regulator [Rhizobium sp. TRM95796]MCV3766634.1 TetR/AcrR family transcriptional regulator [Rhizobium sp. TRM95796]
MTLESTHHSLSAAADRIMTDDLDAVGETARAKRGRGRPKVRSDEEQRDIIVERAADIYLRSGYIAMRMDDISAACRVSKRTLYRLFPSKLHLFRAIVGLMNAQLFDFDDVEPGDTVERALSAIFRVDVDEETDQKRQNFLRQARQDAVASPEIGDVLREDCLDRARRRLTAWFERWSAAGLLSATNPQAAAYMLMDMAYGAADGDQRKGASGRAFIRTCIQYFVNGVR